MQLFAKKFYGFDPAYIPVITFSQIGSRDSLLKKSRPGDRIVYIAVQTEDAQEHERGKILGMAEFGRTQVKTLDFVKDASVLPKKYYSANGDFNWPEGIPMLRAWRFVPAIHRHDVLPKDLIDSMATRTNAILLPDLERDKILALAHEEIEVPVTRALTDARLSHRVHADNFSDAWRWEIARMLRTTINTVNNSNGQTVLRTIKEKNTNLSEGDIEILLRKCLERQNYKCAITGQPLRAENSPNNWFAPSLDRKDSNGHYHEDNLQLVTKAANRAKSNTPHDDVMDYFAALQFWNPSDS